MNKRIWKPVAIVSGIAAICAILIATTDLKCDLRWALLGKTKRNQMVALGMTVHELAMDLKVHFAEHSTLVSQANEGKLTSAEIKQGIDDLKADLRALRSKAQANQVPEEYAPFVSAFLAYLDERTAFYDAWLLRDATTDREARQRYEIESNSHLSKSLDFYAQFNNARQAVEDRYKMDKRLPFGYASYWEY